MLSKRCYSFILNASTRRLFHGTASSKIAGICRNGFDRDYSGTAAGSTYGTGTYFAVDVSFSRGYGDSLLLVRVLTGICGYSSGSGKPNLSIIPGSQNERIHSVVDNTSNPSMYIVSNDNPAYQEYIIYLS
ncbi:Poly [ADP-ribose] polymerase 14 [Trichoplax sp. H2]|nr:Poly [ADP-ribose] polymerase 14 [Trichoplax sp. H2]|eukprot:RDD36026.1 Poly [ADP-ribose] polymerase 14 [Trichoplax sp. H2]